MDLPRPFGPYTLLRRLAVGGMAEVYEAKTEGLGGFEKRVALKVLHPHLSANEHFARMLIDEAKVLVKLNHANIAQVLDLGRIDEAYYIAMEFVDGESVHQLVGAARDLGRSVAPEVVAFVLSEVCAGLDHAHRKRDDDGRPLQLVHRDVSPQNILVSQAGEVKLIDFGIAKGAHRGEGTEVGVIKGKYNYMSPEQAWADPIDRRSDLFSVGVVGWEMLAGRMLHRERSLPRLIADVRAAEIPSIVSLRPDVPRALSDILERATAVSPSARFQSAADMSEALRDFGYRSAPRFHARALGAWRAELMGAHALWIGRRPAPAPSGGASVAEVFTHEQEDDAGVEEGGPEVPTRAGVPPARVERPKRPPLPFDSKAPPTEKMSVVELPPRVTSWPPAPANTQLTRGFDSQPTAKHTSGALAPWSRAAPALSESPPASAQPAEGAATRTAPHRPLSRAAVRPPPSGFETIPDLPRLAAVPALGADGRAVGGLRRHAGLLVSVAVVAALLAALVYRVAFAPGEAAVLELLSEPPGAVLRVDGVQQERRTPLRLDVFEPGRNYELSVEKAGYAPWQGTYHAAPGVVQHIAVLRPLKAELFVSSEPPGATLWIDGVQVGTTPLRVSDLEPGRRILIHATMLGHRSVEKRMTIEPEDLRPRLELVLPRR